MDIVLPVDFIVVPGDVVGRLSTRTEDHPQDVQKAVRLGTGLIQNQETCVATKAGLFRRPTPNYFWVQNIQKRYVAALEDMVIGIIKEKHGEQFRVDIGSSSGLANLPFLSFEGATKKNRPELKVGALVYARVVLATKDMEPQLSCLSVRGKAEGYGELQNGYMFKVSLSLAYQLLDEECEVVQLLGRLLPFEIAVGMNGRVWINSGSTQHTVLIANAILNSEHLSNSQVKQMIAKLKNSLL